MPEAPDTSLAARTLSRLRKLADGNGLAPEKIELIEAQEKIYPLEGILQLLPFCEKQPGRPADTARGLPLRPFGNFAELQAAAIEHQKKFLENRDWIEAARKDLKAAPSAGWGLEGARITFPAQSAVFAAAETCPACQGQRTMTCAQCQGQGFVTCTQCQGRGQELCYNCGGRGENPAHPGQPCVVCHGTRTAPCRFCRSTGKLVCPTCQGRRGVACPHCRGRGQVAQEITLVCGATTQFRIKGEGLPAGLRRGLDRLGPINLGKGHADIKMVTHAAFDADGKEEAPTAKPEVRYEAQLPYADLRMRFGGGRVVLISVLGKRGLLMGVPTFLDDALQPSRTALAAAAQGTGALDPVLAARAMREALTLELGGHKQAASLRRLYPVGMSPDVAGEIMNNMRRALGRFTLHARIPAAIAGILVGTALLAAWFLTALHPLVTQRLRWGAGFMLDLFAVTLVMTLGWVLLSKAVQIALRRRFPDLKISLRRSIGPIGYGMLSALLLAGLIGAAAAPIRPVWLNHFMHVPARGG